MSKETTIETQPTFMKWKHQFRDIKDYEDIDDILKVIFGIESMIEAAMFFLFTKEPHLVQLSIALKNDALKLREMIEPRIQDDKLKEADIIERIEKLDKEIEELDDEYFS